MDTPQVTPALLRAAVGRLLSPGTDAVLGLAADGGWWALGLRRPDTSVLLGVPMSTDTTGAVQQARLADAGLSVGALPVLIDVDDAEDARTVAAQCPTTRFAEVHRALVGAATGAAADGVEQRGPTGRTESTRSAGRHGLQGATCRTPGTQGDGAHH
jgi:uncharacterized protein